MTHQKGDIPVETRIILLERDIELLKLRDGDIRTWQENINRTTYKLESLEKSLDDTRERFDEIKEIFKDTVNSQRSMHDVLLKKIDDLASKPSSDEKKAPDKTNWQSTVETVVKIVFLILILVAGILGIKLPGGLG